MSTEFGWWKTDPVKGKFQVCADVHGGAVTWTCKQGHHSSWLALVPTDEEWDRLIAEAERRVPRRLISPKQFEAIKNLRRDR